MGSLQTKNPVLYFFYDFMPIGTPVSTMRDKYIIYIYPLIYIKLSKLHQQVKQESYYIPSGWATEQFYKDTIKNLHHLY